MRSPSIGQRLVAMVPSAETNAGRWIQADGALKNPFFGAEMLDCGTEVKP